MQTAAAGRPVGAVAVAGRKADTRGSAEIGGRFIAMTMMNERPLSTMTPEPISVITNATLLARRIRELQRRRRAIAEQQEQLRTQLPDWAAEPLRLIGMSNDEIQGLVADLSTVEAEAGLDEVEQRLEEIDRQIEELEGMLASTPSSSLDEIEAVTSVAIGRFREMIVTDPNDVFYDHGESRLLGLIERIHEDLTGLVRRSRLDAS
jgi:hypothetical protein